MFDKPLTQKQFNDARHMKFIRFAKPVGEDPGEDKALELIKGYKEKNIRHRRQPERHGGLRSYWG